MAKFLEKIEEANVEVNTQEAREVFEKVELDSDENTTSSDIYSLRTYAQLKEAIKIILRKLYEQEKSPDIVCNFMNRLLNLAVG